MEQKQELTYTQVGDYLIPDIVMDEQPEGDIGKYGGMRKRYLKEHRKGYYNSLLMTNRLTAHLIEINMEAKEQVNQLVAQMAKAEGVTEELKMSDQMKWVGLMNNIRARAEETVLNDLIYN